MSHPYHLKYEIGNNYNIDREGTDRKVKSARPGSQIVDLRQNH